MSEDRLRKQVQSLTERVEMFEQHIAELRNTVDELTRTDVRSVATVDQLDAAIKSARLRLRKLQEQIGKPKRRSNVENRLLITEIAIKDMLDIITALDVEIRAISSRLETFSKEQTERGA